MGKQYEMAFQIGAKIQGSFGAAFRSASSSVSSLQTTINELNKKQSDISSYQKTQSAIESTKAKLQLYQQQYANMQAAIENNTNASYQEQNALLAKGKAIDDQKNKLAALESKLQSTGEALEAEGVSLENMGQASEEAAQEVEVLRQRQEELADSSGNASKSLMEIVSAVGALEALKTVANAFKECASEAIAFENSMAAVKRTVGGDDNFINSLGEDFKTLSTEIPISTEELAQIASTAGQLGIEQSKVEQFTTVMAKLATTTDLTADEAATMLAQFANITGVSDYERLGSVIALLGDSTATTASKVVQMSQGMAASASIAGFSATDILALSASVGSLGVEAQAGSTAMSQLISTLYKAVETGDNLSEFASVAGMSAEQFKKSWGEDAIGTMSQFITGLNNVERNGKSAIVILDELGISNTRQTKAILGLASAGDLLSNSIVSANNAWEENTALGEKASIMYETTQAKITMMENAFSNVKIAIGDAFTPVISSAADAMTTLLSPVATFIEENSSLVQGIGAALAVMGTLTGAVVAYTAAAKIATAVSAAMTAAIPGAKLLLAIGAAAAVLTGAVVALSDAFKDTSLSMEEMDAEFDELTSQMQQEQAVIDLCEDYKDLVSQVEDTVDAIKDADEFSDIEIDLKAKADSDVQPQEFMANNDPVAVSGEADPAGLIDGADFLLEGTDNVTITGVENTDDLIDGNSFLAEGTDTVEITGVQNESELLEGKDFLEGGAAQAIITGMENASHLLTGADFLKAGSEKVGLTGKAENPIDGEDLVKNTGITIYANGPDEQHKLDANVFVNGKNVSFKAEWENRTEMEAAVEEFKTKASSAKEELTEARSALSDMKEYQSQIIARLNNAGTAEEKNSLQQQLENVNTVIQHQEEGVGRLEEKYEEAAAQYLITASAVEQLEGRDRQLMAMEEQLTGNASGVVEAYGEQSGAILEVVNAKEALAKANQAELKQQLTDSLKQQAAAYASASGTYKTSVKEIEDATAELNSLSTPEDTTTRLASAFSEIQTALQNGEDWDSSHVKGLRSEFENLYTTITTNEWQNGFPNFYAMNSAMQSLEVSTEDVTQAQVELGNEIKNANSEAGAASDTMQTYVDNAVSLIENAGMTTDEVRDLMEESFAEYPNGAALVDEAMAQVEAAISDAKTAAEDFNGEAANLPTADDVNAATQPIIDKMEALAASYNEAYDAAYNSINGQFDLFENVELVKASENSQQAVEDMISSLKSQADYMDQYAENLQTASEMGIDDGLIAQLSDGSTESAQILADIVAGGSDKIDQLNAAFAEVETGKKSFADTVAEMETDFSTKMDALKTELEKTVEEMNQSEEAAAAGAATVQAFADAAQGKLSTVESVFSNIASAASKKLSIGSSLTAYASGTETAERGFAMVGEEGPELVYLNGGEKILNADETQAALSDASLQPDPVSAASDFSGSGGGVVIEYKPQYNISGDVDEDRLLAILEGHDENLRARMEEMLSDINVDHGRMSYV